MRGCMAQLHVSLASKRQYLLYMHFAGSMWNQQPSGAGVSFDSLRSPPSSRPSGMVWILQKVYANNGVWRIFAHLKVKTPHAAPPVRRLWKLSPRFTYCDVYRSEFCLCVDAMSYSPNAVWNFVFWRCYAMSATKRLSGSYREDGVHELIMFCILLSPRATLLEYGQICLRL